MPEPFSIFVPDERLRTIRARLEMFDWSCIPETNGWDLGVGLADLRRLVDYWVHSFDWRSQEKRLNQMPHFTAEIDGHRLHFIHARGNGSRLPLMLVHGWPGSFLEFEKIIAPLVAIGHDVIIPSLPGYAFSGRPAVPIGPRRTATLFHQLMADLFGSGRYLLQGGDWGSAVTAWMAYDYPEVVAALHLNLILVEAADAKPSSPEERDWAKRRSDLARHESAYSHLQATRPQTLGFAMSDSPVGIAAWILEKFGVWSDVPKQADGSPDLWSVFDEDTLLTNIMLYVATQTFVTSTWMYRGWLLERASKFPPTTRVRVPTAVAAFPDPAFPPQPRSQTEKSYDVVRWTPVAHGGHFAALEQPDRLLADMQLFFNNYS